MNKQFVIHLLILGMIILILNGSVLAVKTPNNVASTVYESADSVQLIEDDLKNTQSALMKVNETQNNSLVEKIPMKLLSAEDNVGESDFIA